MTVQGQWTANVREPGQYLITLTGDGVLALAHRSFDLYANAWGPPSPAEEVIQMLIGQDLRNAIRERDAAHLEAAQLRDERDRARAIAVTLEQEISACRDGYYFHQRKPDA